MCPLRISSLCIATGLGAGLRPTLAALQAGRSALAPCTFDIADLPIWTGEVAGLDAIQLDPRLANFDCRNNRLAEFALIQDGFEDAVADARTRYGPRRIGLFLGTSTSGLHHVEQAYRARDLETGALPRAFDYARTHNTYALAAYLRARLALEGPSLVVSCACASTAKIFGNAARMIAAGLCDAAIVGGADTLCLTTLYGFNALGLAAPGPCRPFDAARDGISIGEAAGFALLERANTATSKQDVLVLGVGESNDAYHMSSPHPEGLGAQLAMQRALASAGLAAADIDYVNLHGTATQAGDAAEDQAVFRVFGAETPCNSTKGFTGHTLGAAGIVEAVFSVLAIRNDFIPGSPHTSDVDPAFRVRYQRPGAPARLRHVMSNSFGFGGGNCSVVLGRHS